MEMSLSKKATELVNDRNTKILNKPRTLKKKIFENKKVVTVVIAAYNAETYIQTCIDSLINQSLPFEEIEVIVVDDHSTDETIEILTDYARRYSNITAVLLEENTGTAAMPRNVGIELATTEKIMFLDSDDWLAEDALSKLINTMDENNDDFVVGKTVKVTDHGESILAEFVSYKDRIHVSPFDIPYIFYHGGPPSKLMKTAILKENDIWFPEMKFGEDKFFLFRVLLKCDSISTITTPICYVNRLSNNEASLTRNTTVLDKRRADMEMLKYVAKLDLPAEQDKILLKRLVEYDLVKTCDSFIFVRSNDKRKYIEFIREALDILKDRQYDLIEAFDWPLYQIAARLAEENKDQDFIDLFKWYKLNKNKHVVIKDGIAFYSVTPFDNNHPYKLVPIPLFIRAKDSYVENNEYVQTFEIYGRELDTVKYALIRDRKKLDNEIKVPTKITGNTGELRVKYQELNVLKNSLFNVFVRYDGYRLANIKRISENKITYDHRNFAFYTTKAGNVGFSLKDK
ncbi:glycosyltransferase family 2 protein [Virgibacillus sp. FSP13]